MREFSSLPLPVIKEPPPPVPDYWLAIPQPLTKNVGENRFLWDLRFTPPSAIRHNYPISALYQNTPGEPQGALVAPGTYQAKLSVNGKVYTQLLEVKLDPRVATTQQALEDQQKLVQQSAVLVTASYNFHHQAIVLREAIAGNQKKLEMQSSDTVKALHDFDMKVMHLQGAEGGRGGGPPVGRPAPTFAAINQQMGSLITTIDSADAAPTPAMEAAYRDGCHDLVTVSTQWNTLMTTDLPALNEQLPPKESPLCPAQALPLRLSARRKSREVSRSRLGFVPANGSHLDFQIKTRSITSPRTLSRWHSSGLHIPLRLA